MTCDSLHLRAPVLLAAAMLLLSHVARAHDRSISYSDWTIHDREAQISVRLTALDASRIPWTGADADAPERALGVYLVAHLILTAAGTPCPVTTGPHEVPGAVGTLAYDWTVRCPDAGALRIESTILLALAPSHLHFARVQVDEGAPHERVLSNAERSWTLAATEGASGSATFLHFLVFGAGTMVAGYDHLAFVVALLLVAGSLAEAATAMAGFAMAHSLTLGLTAIGSVRPAAPPLHALIALTVALVAAEDLWLVGNRPRAIPLGLTGALALLAGIAARGMGVVPVLTLGGIALFALCYFELLTGVARPLLYRWMIAFICGLVHGIGFANTFLDASVVADRLAGGLLGFNLGIELGLLGIGICLWPLLQIAATPERRVARLTIVEAGATAMFALGIFWFVTRAYG